MIELILHHVIPAAFELLPPAMTSIEATAMLLAIGLQESRFLDRRQEGGPARGFWQFEIAGIEGVRMHPGSAEPIARAISALRYDHTASDDVIQRAVEHNDVLACCFARCLLYTSPRVVPGSDDPEKGWTLYERCWRPGKPIAATWHTFYTEAWERARRGHLSALTPRKA